MKESLHVGIEFEHSFTVTAEKLVPSLYPEAEEFLVMPEVFATGFLVGLIEWACIRAVNPHLDWPAEQTVGIGMDVKHTAATLPGMEINTKVRLSEIDGKRLVFEFEAHDGIDPITKGRHERFVINKEKFDANLAKKRAKAGL